MAEIFNKNFIVPNEVVRQNRLDRSRLTQLTFPNDLAAHALVMNFVDYTYQDEGNRIVQSRSGQQTTASIMLPVPAELREIYNVSYSDTELGFAGQLFLRGGGGALSAAQDLANAGGAGEVADVVERIGNASVTGAADVAMYLGSASLRGLPGGDAVSLIRQTAINPAMAALLRSVPLREHTFSWRLSPRNEDEQRALSRIIRTARKHMHPTMRGYTDGTSISSLLNYPKAIDMFFMGTELQHSMFFKRAVLTNMQVDHAPDGPSFHGKNGAPTVVTIQMSFKEIEVITAEDFDQTEAGDG